MSERLIVSVFLSTLSLRRATAPPSPPKARVLYFYPRSPCGERLLAVQLGCKSFLFLSTLSLRRATLTDDVSTGGKIISIHALLAESDFANFEGFYWWVISIHALLAESDVELTTLVNKLFISIHALLAESDCGCCARCR